MEARRDLDNKTIILRKGAHWYVINSDTGDEAEMLLALIEYSEGETYNINRSEVLELVDRLGWELEVHNNLGAA